MRRQRAVGDGFQLPASTRLRADDGIERHGDELAADPCRQHLGDRERQRQPELDRRVHAPGSKRGGSSL